MKERALRNKGRQLQAVLDMSQAGIFMTNANRSTIAYANKRMAELFRCNHSDLNGTEFIDYIHPAEIESAKLDMHMMVTGEVEQVKVERRFLRRDGGEFLGTFTAQPLVNDDGPFKGSWYPFPTIRNSGKGN